MWIDGIRRLPNPSIYLRNRNASTTLHPNHPHTMRFFHRLVATPFHNQTQLLEEHRLLVAYARQCAVLNCTLCSYLLWTRQLCPRAEFAEEGGIVEDDRFRGIRIDGPASHLNLSFLGAWKQISYVSLMRAKCQPARCFWMRQML